MQLVYRLKEDRAHVATVQKATLSTTDYGIEQTHGLFGSDEWWEHIVDGSLPMHTIRGTITRVFMSGHNDWPEFEMRDSSGQLSRWTRETNRPEDDVLYVPGCAVEVDIVRQHHRRATWTTDTNTNVVLEIRIAMYHESVPCHRIDDRKY
jgi:hypothetical protein